MRYPKSRLPGPAVKLFDMEHVVDDATVSRDAYDALTVVSKPELEWVLTSTCEDAL
jgi:hypothetical protein